MADAAETTTPEAAAPEAQVRVLPDARPAWNGWSRHSAMCDFSLGNILFAVLTAFDGFLRVQETPAPAPVPAFGFGAAGVGLGTAAGGTGFQFGSFSAFSATPSAPLASTSTEDEAADAQEECKADFAPIVQLDVVDVVTGEENEDVLHEV
eukprot:1176718-Prorocentrum_minimum.AAC.4